jgi:4-amino-4-deoxy-L-arabinose transferase-like glycosyltransferase
MSIPVTAEFARGEVGTRAVLLLALFVWFAATAWVRPLALPDEGRYVGVALEMLWSGDWLVPTLDTLPYFHKPPLFYWLTAASLATFGINEWAARLPSLLAATGSAFAVYLFVRRWAGESQARLSLFVLATTPFFFGGAQFANLDMLVAACIACTILCAADAVLAAENGRPRRSTLVAAYAFAALGILAKGLIGVVIPGLVIGAWLVATGRMAITLRLVSLPGLALFAAIAAPWFALMEARHPGFLHYFFVHHHFQRYTAPGFNSRQRFWFYLPVFAGLTMPWFFSLFHTIRRPAAGDGVQRELHALMWLWLAITLVFFSIPASKLVGYVLAAVPPFAVLAADGFARFLHARGGAQRWRAGMAALAILLCAVGLAGGLIYERGNIQPLATRIRPLLTSANDEIVALRSYPFSLPFYLRHRQPMRVVEEWNEPRLLQKDSWRRELHEAANFDPARAQVVLLKPQDLTRLLACSRRTVWIFASKSEGERHPELARLQLVASHGQHAIWRRPALSAPSDRPGCGG